ncbi:MAG: radical SAM family heme chaperone HemW [Anaerolineae bacterium]
MKHLCGSDLWDTVSLYIHIPFCRAKCAYCDFNSYAGLEHLFDGYVQALVREMELLGQALGGFEIETIYLGGGTPTVLSLARLGDIMAACRRSFSVADDAEISSEANPGTVDGAYLAGLRGLGVNRLSLGVQSFDDGLLRLLGRIHTSAQAAETYRLAREAGFANINLDLIYGLPTQSLAQWRETLEHALALEPDHLSLYALALEEGTPLHAQVARGELPQPDPDLAADMYLLAQEMLGAAGYRHYEISNWARPGYECRHNLTYWRNGPYLGFGAGAHSWFGRRRYHNVLSPQEYIQRLCHGAGPIAESEEIGEALEMAETMIMGLRLIEEGVSFEGFARRFGRRLESLYKKELEELRELGLIEVTEERVRLTGRGRLLGNEVFQRFLPSSEGRG